MSSPYPPQPPRKLERSRSNRFIGGVCGGIATYLNMDPTLVRVLTVVVTFFTGVPILLYILALFLIPEESAPQSTGYPSVQPGNGAGQPYQAQNFTGPGHAAGQPDPVWGSAGAPWEQQVPPAAAAGAPPAEPAAPATAAPDADTPWRAYPGSGSDRPSEGVPESSPSAAPAAEGASKWESAPADPSPETSEPQTEPETSGEDRKS